MKIQQLCLQPNQDWSSHAPEVPAFAPQLVIVFGARDVLDRDDALAGLRERYPESCIVGCSTAGEICGSCVVDGSVVASAIEFDRVSVRQHFETPSSPEDVSDAAARLAQVLIGPELRHVLVFSDGLHINGSELVKGLAASMPPGVSITGGLSGDGSLFERTLVVSGGRTHEGGFVGVGLYGDGLRVGFGSQGGWEPFGPRRLVTRSEHNVLFELDGEPALDVYRRYMGPHAAPLPAGGLLYPLSIELPGNRCPIVRTMLSIDEARGGLVFAGDVPTGVQAHLMRARLDGLVDGAIGAAESCRAACIEEPEFALLVSCVGRRLVLRQRTEEEIEGVRQVLGERPSLAGFYSYGEISAFDRDSPLALHNQTMTITTFAEAA